MTRKIHMPRKDFFLVLFVLFTIIHYIHPAGHVFTTVIFLERFAISNWTVQGNHSAFTVAKHIHNTQNTFNQI